MCGVFALATVAVLVGATRSWSHPFSSFNQAMTPPVLAALLVLLPAALVVSVAAVVVRFARSAGEERLQHKWFAAAAPLVAVTFSSSILTNSVAAAVLENLAFYCKQGASLLRHRMSGARESPGAGDLADTGACCGLRRPASLVSRAPGRDATGRGCLSARARRRLRIAAQSPR